MSLSKKYKKMQIHKKKEKKKREDNISIETITNL
jgi:hypothetical protein